MFSKKESHRLSSFQVLEWNLLSLGSEKQMSLTLAALWRPSMSWFVFCCSLNDNNLVFRTASVQIVTFHLECSLSQTTHPKKEKKNWRLSLQAALAHECQNVGWWVRNWVSLYLNVVFSFHHFVSYSQEDERSQLHDLLEVETIKASKLRHQLKLLPEQMRREIQSTQTSTQFCILFSSFLQLFSVCQLRTFLFQMQQTRPDSQTRMSWVDCRPNWTLSTKVFLCLKKSAIRSTKKMKLCGEKFSGTQRCKQQAILWRLRSVIIGGS